MLDKIDESHVMFRTEVDEWQIMLMSHVLCRIEVGGW